MRAAVFLYRGAFITYHIFIRHFRGRSMSEATNLKDFRVAISYADKYDEQLIYDTISDHFSSLGIDPDHFKGKKVTVKPNLVNKRGPYKATTTHPVFVLALVRYLKEHGASVKIVESPSGMYTEDHLKEVYKASDFYDSAKEAGAGFNFDLSLTDIPAPDGIVSKRFTIIKPLMDADIIIDLCKLKSHSLTKLTCAVKNFFGAIPGTSKVEMHARFSDTNNFCQMLNDLCRAICQQKPVISIADAIMAMEGEGPGTGDIRYLNCILTSLNPFALDMAACELVGWAGTVTMVEQAKEMGIAPKDRSQLEIIGDDFESLCVSDFVAPESQKLAREVSLIPNFAKPRPHINKDICVGCGICAKSCPKKTIEIKNKKANINKKDCIMCFCCQELCPHKAVYVKRSVFFEKILK